MSVMIRPTDLLACLFLIGYKEAHYHTVIDKLASLFEQFTFIHDI